MTMPQCFIGTSGWNYKAWKESLYQGVAQKRWLEHYATRFKAVEVNSTFYRLLKEQTLRQWVERTPDSFTFATKGSRYITHTKRLKDPKEPVQTQRDNLESMRSKLTALCWQMPASMHKDMHRLHTFAAALDAWPWVRHALEFRHTSWFDQEVADCLTAHDLAICISDAADWPRWDRVSTDLVYLRLHGNHETYASLYTPDELQSWADFLTSHLQEERSVHIYFDNTDSGAAVDNALSMQTLLKT